MKKLTAYVFTVILAFSIIPFANSENTTESTTGADLVQMYRSNDPASQDMVVGIVNGFISGWNYRNFYSQDESDVDVPLTCNNNLTRRTTTSVVIDHIESNGYENRRWQMAILLAAGKAFCK